MLCWDRSAPTLRAYSGSILIGTVERTGRGHSWRITAVDMAFIAAGSGTASTEARAERAVEQGWRVWVTRAGLGPG